MKPRVFFTCVVVLLLGLCRFEAAAGASTIQDLSFYNNGTTLDYGADSTFVSDATSAGFNFSAYSFTTGLGTITFTGTTAGPGNFDMWFDEEVSVPFFNEYGTAVGSPATGETWEIGDSYNSSIFNDAAGGALTNTNMLPEGASNYLGNCTGACNGDASTALGDSYLLPTGYDEIITINVSQTAPVSGFYLDQTHPADQNNPSASDVYFSLSTEQVPAGTSNPSPVPEPSTWVLTLTGLLVAGAWAYRRLMLTNLRMILHGLMGGAVVLLALHSANAQSVNTVPLDPTNPASPHTAYSGANIVLGAIFNKNGSTDSFTYSWNFGDGTSATAAGNVSNPNDISARHIYVGTTVGQTWTAVVTVTDTITHNQYTGNYLVIWENNTLTSRVNVAIDLGLWYLHQAMYHPSAGVGYWSNGCASGYSGYVCSGYGSLDAANVQALEVNGHLATGPATDPYTSDVSEAINQMFTNLTSSSVQAKTYTYNTATANYGCSDGTAPLASTGACDASATKVYYNSGGTTCAVPGSCTFTFDGNNNGKAIFATQQGYSWGYEDGQYADAIVASGNPAGVAGTGAVAGETYKDIVQDIADAAEYCQYPGDNQDVESGYTRGSTAYQGGGWWYNCEQGGDNSVSQWAAIGLIGAQRGSGFAIALPKIVADANSMWVTASQDVQTMDTPVSGNPSESSSDAFGAFGYNGALNYSNSWGPFATTPSGMVQMSLDGIGRTTNVAFGDLSTAPDQRFNNAETFYADNFCNSTTGNYANAYYTPRNYTYGLYSFVKSMLLHNPGGTLTPIQYLRTQTPGVFTTNSSIPANTIDWYAALSPANGGTDPCDGIAQTIVGRQNSAGYWYGDNYNSGQNPYETAWSIIMLKGQLFGACVNNLGGRGTAAGANPARIDLTWSGIPNVTGYNVLRSTTSTGTPALVGNTTTTAYSDQSGLTSGNTYYYYLQPVSGASTVCQSNQAVVTIPRPR